MSVKKSWDKPRSKSAAPLGQAPTRSLKERRKRAKRIFLTILISFFVLAVVLCFVLLWQPFFRIDTITTQGAHGEEINETLETYVYGTHAFIIPKDSIVFYDEARMREWILETYPDIAAASITRSSLSSLTVETIPRLESFVWCGVSVELPRSTCYSVDALGLVFKEKGAEEYATALKVFVPLLEGEPENPVRATVSQADNIPRVMDVAEALQALGPRLERVQVRDDEVDMYTVEGVRITYVMGEEENALTLAASTFPTLSFTSGLRYVDLRFKGKAYVKRLVDEAE